MKCIGTSTESHSQSKCPNHHRNLFSVCAKFGAFKNYRSGPLKCTFYYLFLVPVLTGSSFFFMTVLSCCAGDLVCILRGQKGEEDAENSKLLLLI